MKPEDKEKIEQVRNWLTALHFGNSVVALDTAVKLHDGQFRKPYDQEVPYIVHPIDMLCHSLALNIRNDDLYTAILLHDTVEDCGAKLEDLHCSNDARHWIELLTKDKKNYSADKYYEVISKDPKASYIKCLDRINNLTWMASGFETVDKIRRYIEDTEKYFPKLIEVVGKYPSQAFDRASWIFDYQIDGLINTAKRITQ